MAWTGEPLTTILTLLLNVVNVEHLTVHALNVITVVNTTMKAMNGKKYLTQMM
jgi:hypothetical protein